MVNKPLTLIDGPAFAHQRAMTDEELAAHLAEEAGRLLIEQRASALLEGAALGHVADKVANAFLLGGLAEWRPGDAVLSEESFDDKARLGRSRVWIIDPLDGTREYSEGRPDWAVHVALAVDGVPRLGAVAVPAKGQIVPLRPGRGAAARDTHTAADAGEPDPAAQRRLGRSPT